MPITRRTAFAVPLGTALAAPVGVGLAAALSSAGADAQTAQNARSGAQAPAFYRYKVGDVTVTAVNDGIASRPLDGFIRNAPIEAVRQALGEAFLPQDRVPISFTTLVLQIGGRLVLIDTGNGDAGAPTTGTWLANFRAAGFDPAAVDLVLFSHFHADHISGARLKDGTAVFPRAEFAVPEAEWAFWMDDATMARAPDAAKPGFQNVRRVFGPVAKDVTRFAWDKEVAPGVVAVRADGHTPGHTAFAVTSGGGRLMVMSDTTNHPALFVRNPDWSAVFDMDADRARATRRRLLDTAASERMQVAFYHAPFPATGHIARDGDGYAMVPVMWQPFV